MRFDLDKAFGIHSQAILVRGKRAEILASNLANADTPNYKARDIDFKQILRQSLDQSKTGRMLTTNPRHIQSGNELGGVSFELMYRQPLQPSLDGNTVDSQAEKAEFTQNAVQYQASLSFLSGKIKSLQRALKGE